jgi:quercetin dioxygenase-like cupin family protein
MKVVDVAKIAKQRMTDQPLFEGGEVYGQLGFLADVAKGLHIGVMTFEKGGTTKFHVHDFEQVLYAISGKGRVATEKEEYVVTPGMIVFFAPGERHSHGATQDSRFVQLTIMNAGQATEIHRM